MVLEKIIVHTLHWPPWFTGPAASPINFIYALLVSNLQKNNFIFVPQNAFKTYKMSKTQPFHQLIFETKKKSYRNLTRSRWKERCMSIPCSRSLCVCSTYLIPNAFWLIVKTKNFENTFKFNFFIGILNFVKDCWRQIQKTIYEADHFRLPQFCFLRNLKRDVLLLGRSRIC